ncbi:hypothetical protein ES705_44608 [subsurface metagenome]
MLVNNEFGADDFAAELFPLAKHFCYALCGWHPDDVQFLAEAVFGHETGELRFELLFN